MKIPKNNWEFRKYLKKANAKFPELWVSGEYKQSSFLQFALFRYVWGLVANPSNKGSLSREIEYHYKVMERNPKFIKGIPREVKILEKMIKLGISEEEILYLMREYQIDGAYAVFTALDQGIEDFDEPISGVHLFLTEDYDKPIGEPISNALSQIFKDAIPNDHPECHSKAI